MTALPQMPLSIISAIDKDCEKRAQPRLSNTINPSSIGQPCERALFYKFRWAVEPERHTGRILRLFETGQLEETRLIGWLREAGVAVKDRNPETGEQWEIHLLDSHMHGYLDGIIEGGLPEAPKARHVLECKTHNAKSFEQLSRHGVAVAKPEHVAQMQIYMHATGIERALYLAKNKDNDALYAERVKYDKMQAEALLAKAERIKTAERYAPPKISENPDSFACRFCPAINLCHGSPYRNILPPRNCRTCLHSSPIAGGKWHCARHDKELDNPAQKAGCDNHLYLPALVPGEILDADEERNQITYQMRDGEKWTDFGEPS